MNDFLQNFLDRFALNRDTLYKLLKDQAKKYIASSEFNDRNNQNFDRQAAGYSTNKYYSFDFTLKAEKHFIIKIGSNGIKDRFSKLNFKGEGNIEKAKEYFENYDNATCNKDRSSKFLTQFFFVRLFIDWLLSCNNHEYLEYLKLNKRNNLLISSFGENGDKVLLEQIFYDKKNDDTTEALSPKKYIDFILGEDSENNAHVR